MPGQFGEHAGLDTQARIGAAIQILRKQGLAFGVFEEVRVQRLELFRRDRLVARPPHVLVGVRIANGEFVLGAAAGKLAGVRAQRAIGGKHGFAGPERMLIELWRAKIPIHTLEIL